MWVWGCVWPHIRPPSLFLCVPFSPDATSNFINYPSVIISVCLVLLMFPFPSNTIIFCVIYCIPTALWTLKCMERNIQLPGNPWFNRVVCLCPAEAQHQWRGPGSVWWKDCRGERRWLRCGPVAPLQYTAGKLQLRRTGQADQQQEVSLSSLSSPSLHCRPHCLSKTLDIYTVKSDCETVAESPRG